jgi:hypothetical protein
MADENVQVMPAAEFQALPLESIIASPLKGAIEAQAIAAATTKAFIESMIGKDNKPVSIPFNIQYKVSNAGGTTEANTVVNVPLLAIVPVPHLRIDSLTTHFKYEINAVTKSEHETSKALGGTVGTTGILSKFVNVSLNGSISSKSREESTTNRSGMLEITVHASEAPMPEGLAKILSLLASTIPPSAPLPAAPAPPVKP